MSPFNMLMTRSTTFTEEEMAILGGAIILGYLFWVVIAIIYFFIKAVPLFIMGKKAGFKHAWLAFIPFGQSYVAMTLPHREFNIFKKFKTTNRKKAFWAYMITWGIWLGTAILNEVLSWVSTYLTGMDIESMSIEGMLAMLVGMIILLVVELVVLAVTLVNTFAMCMIRWRIYYDLMHTYREPDNAMWVSVLSVFFDIVIIIYSYCIMSKTPEYGLGNYYSTEIIYSKPQNSGKPRATVNGSNAPSAQPGQRVAEAVNDEEKLPGSGLAIAAFVCGIISFIGVPFANLAALICGFMGKGKYPTYTTEYKRCRQGIVMSLISCGIGILLGIVVTLIWMIYIFG